jgi:hypothetical protein
MAEFAAGAAVLSLLMLGTVTLSGYQEVQRRTLSVARQAAYTGGWDVNAQMQPLAARLYATHFNDAGAADPISGDRYTAENDLRVNSTWNAAEGAAADAAHLMLDPLRVSTGLGNPGFDLRNSGLLQGRVDARIGPLSRLAAPFASLELEMSSPFALLADAWHAANPAHVRRRTSGLVPAARLTAFGGIWQGVSTPLRIVDPSIGQLCLGLIEAERVPEDRLGPGSTPLPAACP